MEVTRCRETHKGWRGAWQRESEQEKQGEEGGVIISDMEFYCSMASFFQNQVVAFVFLMPVIYRNVNKSTKNWEKTDQLQNQNFKQYIL